MFITCERNDIKITFYTKQIIENIYVNCIKFGNEKYQYLNTHLKHGRCFYFFLSLSIKIEINDFIFYVNTHTHTHTYIEVTVFILLTG